MSGQYNLIGDPHKLLACPYNMSHLIESYKMATHLEKCRRSYPNVNKSRCPFDSSHIVNEVELQFHTEHCEKREIWDRIKYGVDDGAGFQNLAETPQLNDLVLSEDWDDEKVPGFNPNDVQRPGPILRKLKGAQPAERRAFRMAQRKNFSQQHDTPNKS